MSKFKWLISFVLSASLPIMYVVYNSTTEVQVSVADSEGDSQHSSATKVPAIKDSGVAKAAAAVGKTKPVDLPVELEPEVEPEVAIELDQQAIDSLRQARLDGDDRTPAIERPAERELPSEEQLNDPELYQQYEQQQKRFSYRAYVEAAKDKVNKLNDMIEQGKQAGISQEQIEMAEEKVKGIEEMSLQLQQEFPEIMSDDYAPKQPVEKSWLETTE